MKRRPQPKHHLRHFSNWLAGAYSEQVRQKIEHRMLGSEPASHRAPLSAYGSGEHKTGPRQR